MPERLTEAEAHRLLARWAVGSPRLVGAGMEGVVYALSADRVAKIWFAEPATGFAASRAFYDALGGLPLSFAVPQVVEIHEVQGHTITIERFLHGTPLSEIELGREPTEELFVGILGELAGSGRCPQARALSVLGEPLSSFVPGLGELAARRAERFRRVLSSVVEDFDRKAAALVRRLPEVDSGVRVAVHGDLYPGNVLVNGEPAVSAVLDWGFFSTEGDPVFEAAVTASLVDMYGDDALVTEMSMYDRIQDALGYSRADLLVYRAAYSLITANAYDPEGNDGHFAWCARALNRPDVVKALHA
jgi:Phosphotransferase enzyme family